jgi:hypothetical protein
LAAPGRYAHAAADVSRVPAHLLLTRMPRVLDLVHGQNHDGVRAASPVSSPNAL